MYKEKAKKLKFEFYHLFLDENNQYNTSNQLLPDIAIKRPNFFYQDETAEEIELASPKKTIMHDSNSVKKLLNVESKRNNLFTDDVDSN